MESDGYVDHYGSWDVTGSCGRSPGIVDSDIVAFFVLSSGKVYDEYLYGGYVKDSYGKHSPDRRDSLNGYFTNQYGYIAYDDYGVQYSYG